MALNTSIHINSEHSISVTLSSSTNLDLDLFKGVSLQYLSVVEVSRIPLHTCLGSPFVVTSEDIEVESWLSNILLAPSPHHEASRAWWEQCTPESPLGILVGVNSKESEAVAPASRITELLIYATKDAQLHNRPLTPPASSPQHEIFRSPSTPVSSRLIVHAQPLSSDQLHCQSTFESTVTPPASPTSTSIDAIFLFGESSKNLGPIHELPVKRRRTAADAFDEVSERRKAARRGGSATIAAAAASSRATEALLPTLRHRRSISGTSHQAPPQGRTLSRSPSVASTRPSTAVAQRSSLSRVQQSEDVGFEARNKEFVSRIVMAGMRLFGLTQSKKRAASKAPLETSAQSRPETPVESGEDRENDQEYKLIYHQVFKGVCFAFRGSIASQTLLGHSDAVRETADKLLQIFCRDPLAGIVSADPQDSLVMKGGRAAFGVASPEASGPFAEARLIDVTTSAAKCRPQFQSRPSG